MKTISVSKRGPLNGYHVIWMVGAIVSLLTFLLIPNHTRAEILLAQHDLPQPAPSQEPSPVDSFEWDLRQSPSLSHKTPGLSSKDPDSLGFFLDKNRQGLGLQWAPGGKIPGVDLGLESHNLYSLNRILPREGSYPNWTAQDDSQYFGNPRTAPDHSGAFLRFRW